MSISPVSVVTLHFPPAVVSGTLMRPVSLRTMKTFSMGHSREKRYYLEGRKIR